MIPTAAKAAKRLWATYELIKSDCFEDEGVLIAARSRANLDRVLWPSDAAVQQIAAQVGAKAKAHLGRMESERDDERAVEALLRYAPITSDSSGNVAAGLDEELGEMQREARHRKLWRMVRRAFRWRRA